MTTTKPHDILTYWFMEIGRERWFDNDPTLDVDIRERFLALHDSALRGELKDWENTPEGSLALMLLLDQFPRRMFRDTAKAYESDEIAIELARNAIIRHFDDRIDRGYKFVFYLPFINSESLNDQRLAIYYIRERAREDEWLDMAEKNFHIVERFGRFPQRNPILGRETTPEEVEFLKKTQTASSQTMPH